MRSGLLKSLLVAAAVALVVPCAASARFPAIRAVVTITGQTSGQQTIKDQVPPNNSDCPTQDAQQQESATISWKVTFKPVIVPLRKTGFVLKNAPRGKGGVTGGSFNYNSAYLKDDPNNQDACPTMASFSASAKLFNKPPPFASWDGRSWSPDDIFYLGYPGLQPTNIHSTPAQFNAPVDESDGSASGLVPVEPAADLPIYDINVHPGNTLQAFDASVLVNWNKLQRKLRPLAHGRSVTLTVSSSVDNSRKPVPFHNDCPDVGPPSGPSDYGVLSCTESMTVHYTIKIRPTGPAHGCDIATAKHCLI